MMAAFFVLCVTSVILAWLLAQRRRCPEHRPIALLLSLGLVAAASCSALDTWILAPFRAQLGINAPWSGWARAACIAHNATWLTWQASLVAASLVVFANTRPFPALLGWLCFLAVDVVVHPIAGDGSQARFLGGAQILAVGISVWLLIAWLRRITKPVTSAQFSLAMLVAMEATSALTGWWAGSFARWDLSQLLGLLSLAFVIIVQGGYLWSARSSS